VRKNLLARNSPQEHAKKIKKVADGGWKIEDGR
jgi:hypothetical protein